MEGCWRSPFSKTPGTGATGSPSSPPRWAPGCRPRPRAGSSCSLREAPSGSASWWPSSFCPPSSFPCPPGSWPTATPSGTSSASPRGMTLLALAMAFLVYTGWVRYGHVLLFAFLYGALNAMDQPVRQSFTVELAGKERYPGAIALNSFGFNTSRLVGPAVAGFLIAFYGVGAAYLANALSFLPILWVLSRLPPGGERGRPGTLVDGGPGGDPVRPGAPRGAAGGGLDPLRHPFGHELPDPGAGLRPPRPRPFRHGVRLPPLQRGRGGDPRRLDHGLHRQAQALAPRPRPLRPGPGPPGPRPEASRPRAALPRRGGLRDDLRPHQRQHPGPALRARPASGPGHGRLQPGDAGHGALGRLPYGLPL